MTALPDVEGPAVVYVGSDGSTTILDRVDWGGAASVRLADPREHAIMLALLRYTIEQATASQP